MDHFNDSKINNDVTRVLSIAFLCVSLCYQEFFLQKAFLHVKLYHTTVVYCSSEETKCWWALLTDRCTAHFYPCHNYNCEIPIILFTQENNIFCYCHQSSPYYFLYNYLCKCYCHSWFCVYMRVCVCVNPCMESTRKRTKTNPDLPSNWFLSRSLSVRTSSSPAAL